MSAARIAGMIRGLVQRIDDLERKQANMMRPGKVVEVDYDKALVKVKAGDLTSTWVPWMEQAGSIKTWTPPSVGQQVHLFSPSGEPGQGWVMPAGYSSDNPKPHDKGGEHNINAAKIILTGDVIINGRLDVNGAGVTHNGHDIGDTHKHKDSMAGPDLTGVPQ